jgi:lipid-A-disaccharide synthase-like uncharacterized protein
MNACAQHSSSFWLYFGFAAQGLFTARFLVQWLYSEKLGKSVIPLAFWYFSLAGGLMLFIYAVQRHEPVFAIGQATGLIIYMRNLYLIHVKQKRVAD